MASGGGIQDDGKGTKERVVPFEITVQKLHWKYLNFYRPEPTKPYYDYLFLTKDGRPFTMKAPEQSSDLFGKIDSKGHNDYNFCLARLRLLPARACEQYRPHR